MLWVTYCLPRFTAPPRPQAADSPSLQQLLGAQLARAAPPRLVPADDVAAVTQLLAGAAAQQRQRGRSLGGPQQQQVLLALEALLAWAGASARNANRLAEAGAGHLLADLAAMSATGTGVDGLQSRIAQVKGCPCCCWCTWVLGALNRPLSLLCCGQGAVRLQQRPAAALQQWPVGLPTCAPYRPPPPRS